MPTGRPDYNLSTVIKGNSPGGLIPVSVDASGNLYALIQGEYAGSPKVVAVDASGNIIGLLQGYYNSSPIPIAVDAQGRMLAVLTDPADMFGNPHFMGGAELATRLGAISRYARGGEVYWQTSFEPGFEDCYPRTYGAGSAVSIVTSPVRTGRRSVHLSPGDAVGDYAGLTSMQPAPVTGMWGVELSFTVDTPIYPLRISMVRFDGIQVHTARIEYNINTSSLQYLDSNNVMCDLFAGLALSEDLHLFHTLKLIVDQLTNTYRLVMIDGITWDMTGIGVYSAANPTPPGADLVVTAYRGSGTGVTELYIDDWIFTANEAP